MSLFAWTPRRTLLTIICLIAANTLAFLVTPAPADADDTLAGYSNYQALRDEMGKLAGNDFVTLRSLGKTLEDRDILMLTLSIGDADKKPAIALVGNVDAGHLLGSELAMQVARQLAEQIDEPEIASLLKRFTIYVIPRPSPDASEKCFALPRRRPVGNSRQTDDDRDHKRGEDPPEDLNGDGLITMMRVADVTGPYRRHPHDPRVLVRADRTKGEKGEFQLYIEGVDNDGDGKWNEDAGDGVAFNRNFTFNYPYFGANAGPHQISERETRAVGDFLFNQTNIAAVVTFTPDDNLAHHWKPGKNPPRMQKYIDAGDLGYVKALIDPLRKRLGLQGAPAAKAGAGSFSEWAYFHYGRWSLATRGWTIPPSESKKKNAGPGQADLEALAWMDANDVNGFVDWQPIEHVDFPGQQVEIGGFKPFVRDNPPAAKLDELGARQLDLIKSVLDSMPKISIHKTDIKSLGAGVYRVKATVVNEGRWPTSSEMGRRSRGIHRVQVALDLPEGAELIRGPIRTQLPVIVGSGGKAEHTWLLRVDEEKPKQTTIRAWAPAVGEDQVEIELK